MHKSPTQTSNNSFALKAKKLTHSLDQKLIHQIVNSNESDFAEINCIIWIALLNECDLGPTRRLIEDLEPLCKKHQIEFRYFAISSIGDLVALFGQIKLLSESELRPLLHIDAHGNPDKGMMISPSSEFVPWVHLTEELRNINIATKNNLVVVLSCCYAYNAYAGITLNQATPYYFMIAPPREITIGEIIDKMNPFYIKLLETDNLFQAYFEELHSSMTHYHCQQIFFWFNNILYNRALQGLEP